MTKRLIPIARRLRNDQTLAEKKLWYLLRTDPFKALHFRRQAPMGSYIVDFVAHGPKLVVELDGGQHADGHQFEHDRVRDAWLVGRGYRVLRFWNIDVMRNPEGVATMIADAIIPPPLTPPRKGEGNDPSWPQIQRHIPPPCGEVGARSGPGGGCGGNDDDGGRL